MIPSHPASRRPPGLAQVQEPPAQGPAAAPPPPEGLPPRRTTPGGSPAARMPRQALAILQPQAVADAAAQASAQSNPDASGTAWWNLPPDSNPHGDAAWWATLAAELRAEEPAGPRTQAARATPPRVQPLPESDDESEDGDFPWILCDTSLRAMEGAAGIGPTRREALARHAEDIANLEDFRLVVDLRENNHEVLSRSVWDLHDAALHFHADWRATRGRESLAKAQGLDIKHKVLEGLCALKQQDRDRSRLNPQIYEPVIHSLRDALARCRAPASAVAFPIRGFDAPLQELERLVQETQDRLERREYVVRLPGDPDAAQVRAERIQAWRTHGQAIEAYHGPQDWEAMQEILVERRVESFAQAQACKVPPELLAAVYHAQNPRFRQAATANMLRPVMAPLAWALARQVHSEIVPAGQHPPQWRARQANELQHRLQTFAAALAEQVYCRLTGAPPGLPRWITAQEAALQNEMRAFTFDLAHRAHHQLVVAEYGPMARQEVMLQSDLRALADPPARVQARAAMHQKLTQACRTLGNLAAELRTALQGPQSRPTSGTATPQPGDLGHAPQALQLADVPAPSPEPVHPQAAALPAQALGSDVQAAPPDHPAAGPRLDAAVVAASAQAPAVARPPRQERARPLPAAQVPPVRAEVPVRDTTQDITQALQALQVADGAPDRPRSPVRPPRQPGAGRHLAQETTPTPRPAPPALSPANAEPRPDPAIEAARLQQEQVTALQAALAPFLAEAERCVAAARACGDVGPATEPAWARQSREFAAWQAAVQAHDACAAQVSTQADALFGPTGPQPAAVRPLREEAAQASRHALTQATQAARGAWESFSEVCDATLVQRGMPDEGLAARCRELHAQWSDSPLRERMQALGAHMEQYRAFEIACTVTTQETETGLANAADILHQARQWRTAMDITDSASRGTGRKQARRLKAFRGFCAEQRDTLLSCAVGLEILTMKAVHVVLCNEVAPAIERSYGSSILYDTLLTGDPLPDEDASAQHPLPSPSSVMPPAGTDGTDERAADEALVESVRQAARSAAELRERAITLPEDASPLNLSEHQAMLAMLRQGELRGQTAEAVISRFHALSKALETARPTRRPGIAEDHAGAMKQLVDALSDHATAMAQALQKPLNRGVFNQLAASAALLRADLRLAERSLASVQTLQHLLTMRVTANQARRGVLQGKYDLTMGTALRWEAHRELVKQLDQARALLLKRVDDDRGLVGEQPWTATELTHIKDGLRRLKNRVECEEAVIRAKLLLARAERAGDPKSMQQGLPFSIPALRESITAHTQALVRVNQEIKEIGPSSGQSQAYEAQLKINQGLQRQLLELQVALRDDLKRAPGHQAANDTAAPLAQHDALEAAARQVMEPPACSAPEALLKAEPLCDAVSPDLRRIQALHTELGPSLESAVHRSRTLATDCHVLLTGDPLPDPQAAGPAQPAGPQAPQEDRALIRQARQAVKRVGKLRQPAISLPPDAPPRAVYEQQAGRLILRQIDLRAQTTAAVMSGFYDALSNLQATGPTRRPAIAQRHADTMAKLAADLDQALQDLNKVVGTAPAGMDLLGACCLQLRADLGLARRMEMSWQVLDRLLSLRVAADQVRRRFERGELAELEGPEVRGTLHLEVLDSLAYQGDDLHQELDKVRGLIKSDAWVAEYKDITDSEVQLIGKVECERVMIQARLLLAWAEGALRPVSRPPQTRRAIVAFKALVDQHLPVLEQANRDIEAMKPSSGHGGAHDLQLAVNRQVRDKLQELQEKLGRMLQSGAGWV